MPVISVLLSETMAAARKWWSGARFCKGVASGIALVALSPYAIADAQKIGGMAAAPITVFV